MTDSFEDRTGPRMIRGVAGSNFVAGTTEATAGAGAADTSEERTSAVEATVLMKGCILQRKRRGKKEGKSECCKER